MKAETAARRRELTEARAYYQQALAGGVDRFLEPRRRSCPWCGSDRLAPHVSTGDIIQRKPGVFTLDRCGSCRHIFQNPRLTPEGLHFYYRDYYDGLGTGSAARHFRSQQRGNLDRAELVRRFITPETWLDIGTGHGHFCRDAAEVLAHTAFDGLDRGDGVAAAQRKGWIRRGFQANLLEVSSQLTGGYDVVSMHHYLEHTRDPHAEIDAALTALRPGGYLLIELPDPESFYAGALRRFWLPWLQPQHQHMIPLGNLKALLADRRMEIVAETTRAAQQKPDVPRAALVLLNELGPDPRRPWAPSPPSAGAFLRRLSALALAGPVLAGAHAAQSVTWPFVRHHANAYRLLARLPAASAAPSA